MPLLLLFVALPLIEIALFVIVGGQIGVLGVIGLIVLSAFGGMAVLRGQQARMMMARQGVLRLSPGMLLAEGAFRLLAGVLLIMPGFLTDALGLVLLVPLAQRLILASVVVKAQGRMRPVDDDVIDGEFEVRDPGHAPVDPGARLPGPHA